MLTLLTPHKAIYALVSFNRYELHKKNLFYTISDEPGSL